MFKEFREFISKGSVIDLAVGIIIGGAFQKIVSSLVNDVIMPPVGLLVGRVNFNSMYVSLNGQNYPSLAAAQAAGVPTINYGLFINNIIEFLIVALVIFLAIKYINKLRRHPPKEPDEKQCQFCYTMIPIKATRCPNCTSKL